MKHILNDLTKEEKNSILEQYTGGKKIMIENFNKLLNSTLGDSKPLMEEEETSSKEGRNNPVWINLVNTLKNLSYPPRILTFNSYDTPPIPSQSMNWGTTKGPNGNYGFAIASTDHIMPKEEIQLFCDDKLLEKKLIQWWADLGYKINRGSISVNFEDASDLKIIIDSFFKKYPPSK